VLRVREHAPTPSPSVVFTFGLEVEFIKELGGASRKAHNLERQSHIGHEKMYLNYFYANIIYDDKFLKRCSRMKKNLFVKNLKRIVEHDSYFLQKKKRYSG